MESTTGIGVQQFSPVFQAVEDVLFEIESAGQVGKHVNDPNSSIRRIEVVRVSFLM